MAEIWIAYVIIGGLAGVLGGLLGIGGGVITVPCLLYLFRLQGFPTQDVMHLSIATSLAAMVFNTLASSWGHQKKGHIVWNVFYRLIPGLVVGSCLGALLANALSGVVLEVFFGLFLITLAVHFYRQRPLSTRSHTLPRHLWGWGGLIGMLSTLLGIGGGSLTVPLLTAFKIGDRQAIGTSAITTLMTTVLGTILYLILGRDRGDSPWGCIEPTAFVLLGIAACVAAPLGVKLTETIHPHKIRTLFALVLAFTGLSLITGEFRKSDDHSKNPLFLKVEPNKNHNRSDAGA